MVNRILEKNTYLILTVVLEEIKLICQKRIRLVLSHESCTKISKSNVTIRYIPLGFTLVQTTAIVFFFCKYLFIT